MRLLQVSLRLTLLQTNKHVVEARVPVNALEVLPPETQAAWIIGISLNQLAS